MYRDLSQFDDGAVIETELAIIGAGAAGITIARDLIGTRHEVWLIESGGFELDAGTQELYEGDSVGVPYFPLDSARLRFFGGSTNHWAGHCRPLDPMDFERREWVPHSGWPITRAELDPFYGRAQSVCGLGPYRYKASEWPQLDHRLIHFAPDKVVNRLWQFSPPTRFGQAYGAELKAAPNIHLLTHANAVDIRLNDAASQVSEVTLKTLQGRTAALRPKAVVLACGGIENPRLMLASDGVDKNGLGNRYDLVGRFFMEHPHALAAYAVPQIDIGRLSPYYAQSRIGTTVFRAKPGIAEPAQRRLRVLNGCLDLGRGYDRSEGFLALRDFGEAISEGQWRDDLGEDVIEMIADLDGLAAGLYRRFRHEDVIWFGADVEQVPNPDSRVALEPARDALGMRKVRLDWRISTFEKDSVRAIARLVGEELARLEVGGMRLDHWLVAEKAPWRHVEGRYHHMGTTRMSDDPRQGVVDRNCRVHGVANMFVAGSSVFATSGYANPTLTICALALRLSAHLKQVLPV